VTRFLIVAVIAASFVGGGAVRGQSPLEELERRLQSGALAPRTPGYLGLTADDRDTDGRGLRVVAVQPGSPAEAAGLRVGDLLVEIERRSLRTTNDMSAALASRTAGQSIAITLERAERQHVVTARLGTRPAADAAEEPLPAPEPSELPPPSPPRILAPEVRSPAEEIDSLRREAAELRSRLEQLERRLAELEARVADDPE
jgi:membrane-associated protease RseP (regulator of RpoE activity)